VFYEIDNILIFVMVMMEDQVDFVVGEVFGYPKEIHDYLNLQTIYFVWNLKSFQLRIYLERC